MEDSTLNDFKRELAAIATIRDELTLKAHLASADIKRQLSDLEGRWLLAEEQVTRVKAHARHDISAVQRELRTLLSDLTRGYSAVVNAFAKE